MNQPKNQNVRPVLYEATARCALLCFVCSLTVTCRTPLCPAYLADKILVRRRVSGQLQGSAEEHHLSQPGGRGDRMLQSVWAPLLGLKEDKQVRRVRGAEERAKEEKSLQITW